MLRERIGVISYTCYRAIFFSLIKAPAIALFIVFLFLSFNNSIADSFLTEARSLVRNAPEDKVEVCLPDYLSEQNLKELNISIKNKPSPCEKIFIDAIDWKKSLDSSIRDAYWNIVVLGFLIWCIMNLNFSVISKNKKPIEEEKMEKFR
ncbi:TPA: hypothetical protein G9F11_005014 [Salmonella enterica]|uniref:Uncharacterized protein n=1 Tax=Salmonella enterica TaxID=28901 RepID=A0A750HQY4_SALER|nr:hypothetical protein [Salmonella enterica]EIG0951994.1 hypothetical protein [Salmonella enterica subsp. enterica serovar Muenchen]HAF2715747.1 hypothetical protein [Salmonella enterica]HAF6262305.1 hypothetical protein [Salmonella enterica]